MKNKALEFVLEQTKKDREEYQIDIYECIAYLETVYSEEVSVRNWWIETFEVVQLGDRLIGFNSARATGENSPLEIGWEFNEDSICFVEKYEKTITAYRKAS